ncbi:MAG: T9SS type A sorting domain-containing protein [Bacteroidetes bacterium]|nr:T9SS type A sorting domain-containing protein [Bacteroidota bacterium]
MQRILLTILSVFLQLAALSQSKVWDKTFGGQNDDAPIFNYVDSAGNVYVFGNISYSAISLDITTQYGNTDFVFIKYDKNGNKIFDKCYGGSGDDVLKKVIVDGNDFYLIGLSDSPISGVKTDPVSCSPYSKEMYYFKIDLNGMIISQDNICLPNVVSFYNAGLNPIRPEEVYDFRLLSNGQFAALLLASNYTLGANNETMIVAINFNSNLLANTSGVVYSFYTSYYTNSTFEKFYGGKIIQIPTGDYVIGLTLTMENWTAGNYPSYLYDRTYISTVISLDAGMSSLQSQRYLFNNYRESFFEDIIYFNNKVYVVSTMYPYNSTTINMAANSVGSSYAWGSQIVRQSPARCNNGQKDLVVHRLNTNLSYDSDFSFGVNGTLKYSSFAIDTANQVFHLLTSTDANASFDKSQNAKGGFDFWQLNVQLGTSLVKLDDRTYGSSGDDFGSSVFKTSRGFYLTGSSSGGVGGDKTQSLRGMKDIWNLTLCSAPRWPVIKNAGQIFNLWVPYACTGKPKLLQIDSVNTSLNYNWYSVPSGGSLIDTGIFHTTAVVSTTNSPIYVESNNGLCSSQRMPVFISPIATPQKPTIVTPSIVCLRDTLTLSAIRDTATNPFPIYYSLWYDSLKNQVSSGSDLFTISNISAPVKMFLSTRDSMPGGISQGYSYSSLVCQSTLDSTTVVPDVVPTPIISNPNPTCFGSTITLSVSNAGVLASYWYSQSTSQLVHQGNPFLIPSMVSNDSFQVVLQKANGCRSLADTITILLEKPIAGFSVSPTQLNAGDPIQFINTSQGIASSNWNFGDGGISYNQNPWHYYNIPGTFSVQLIVTSSTGCMDSILKPNLIFVNPYLGIDESSANIQLYPNPATTALTINGLFEMSHLTLTNSMGQLILELDLTSGENTLALDQFARGMYYLQLTTPTKNFAKTILIH